MIDVIDFNGGNTGSLFWALDRIQVKYQRVKNPKDLLISRHPMILPGVGAFGAVMERLADSGLDKAIRQALNTGRKFLGVCIGMQVLFEKSQESLDQPGLGIIPGEVVRFTQGKIPQIGWNEIKTGINKSWDPGFVYFVNSPTIVFVVLCTE